MSSAGNTTASIMAVAKRSSARSGKQRKTPSTGTTGKAGTLLSSTTLLTSTQRPAPRSNAPFPLQFFRMGNGAIPRSNNLISITARSIMAWFFFCLASAEGAGLLFLSCCNTAPYKRLQHVLCHLCNYTANAAKQHTWLCSGFSYDCTSSTAYNTRPTQTAIIPPAPCWRVSQHRRTSSAYPRYHRHAGRYTGQHSRPIIIMYIRVQVRPLL